MQGRCLPGRQRTQLSTPYMAQQPCSSPASGVARHRQCCCVMPMHLSDVQPQLPESHLKPHSHTAVLADIIHRVHCAALQARCSRSPCLAHLMSCCLPPTCGTAAAAYLWYRKKKPKTKKAAMVDSAEA
jgi:hypothetical protein